MLEEKSLDLFVEFVSNQRERQAYKYLQYNLDLDIACKFRQDLLVLQTRVKLLVHEYLAKEWVETDILVKF